MEFTSVILLFVVVAIVVVLLSALKGRAGSYPYQRLPGLFSADELAFFNVLDRAVGDRYRVFGKVRVADVVKVKPLSDRRAWQQAFNRISAKHFDYVLCRPGTREVAAVVELDDKSHAKRDRQARDRFIEAVCQSAGLPLIRVAAKRRYQKSELSSQIHSVLGYHEFKSYDYLSFESDAFY